MKKLIVLLGLTSLTCTAFAFIEPLEELDFAINPQDTIKEKIIKSYCWLGKGTVKDSYTEVSHKAEFQCEKGAHSAQYFYEAWATNKQDLTKQPLDPDLRKDPTYETLKSRYIEEKIIQEELAFGDNCRLAVTPISAALNCTDKTDKTKKISKYVNEKYANLYLELTKDEQLLINYVNEQGKKESATNNPGFISSHPNVNPNPATTTTSEVITKKIPVVSGTPTNGTPTVSGTPTNGTPTVSGTPTNGTPTVSGTPTNGTPTVNVTSTVGEITSSTTVPAAPATNTGAPVAVENPTTTPNQNITPATKTTVEDKDCAEELKSKIAELLADDKKNILGLQYELTVLKMATLSVGSSSKTLEGLVRKKNQEIQKLDQNVITKMKEMYSKYGVKEDAEKVAQHLKEKSKQADYGQKDKRFFNQDSSAFLMAYQQMNPNSGIKDSDVSVLWLFNKIAQKSKTISGNGSSAFNRTNLSTRIAQYTGITGAKAYNKDELEGLSKKLKAKIDKELLGLIENFKNSNKECYKKLGFGEGADDCNLNLVDESLSQILAVNSQISLDLVDVNGHLKGVLKGDKYTSRFALNRFIDGPEKAPTTTQPTTTATTQPTTTATTKVSPENMTTEQLNKYVNDQLKAQQKAAEESQDTDAQYDQQNPDEYK